MPHRGRRRLNRHTPLPTGKLGRRIELLPSRASQLGNFMEIILYYAPTTCALAPYITLTKANAEFEARGLLISGKTSTVLPIT